MEIEELIKIIIGILVVLAIAVGLGIFFKEQIIDFFKGISVGKPRAFILLIK